MNRNLLPGLLVAAFGLAGPAFAQTAGVWAGDATKLTLTAADGSAVISFQCDPVAAALVLTSNYGTGTPPQRITVRANNGTAYSVPLQASNRTDELVGGISTSLVNQDKFAQATTLIVSAPPSGRPDIIVDVVPELGALVAACPRA